MRNNRILCAVSAVVMLASLCAGCAGADVPHEDATAASVSDTSIVSSDTSSATEETTSTQTEDTTAPFDTSDTESETEAVSFTEQTTSAASAEQTSSAETTTAAEAVTTTALTTSQTSQTSMTTAQTTEKSEENKMMTYSTALEKLIGDKKLSQSVERSALSYGNNYRLKSAIDKAKKGEYVNVAYLGGSITEGALAQPQKTRCYAALSHKYINDTFGTNNNVRYINAGLSGTPSMLGLVRAEREVIKVKPDVVFIEFAVNDRKDKLHPDAYEGLIRKVLNSDTKPAVVLVFFCSETMYTCEEHMSKIGSYYDLPMISIVDGVKPLFDDGTITWRDYSPDYTHPSTDGHALAAMYINNFISHIDTEAYDSEKAVPEKPLYSDGFEQIDIIDSKNFTPDTMGSFAPAAPIPNFRAASGWNHKSGSEPMKFDIVCEKLIFVYELSKSSSYGAVEIFVDGKSAGIFDGHSDGGWNNPETVICFDGKGSTAKHSVEVRIAEGSEDKVFNILAFGAKKQ